VPEGHPGSGGCRAGEIARDPLIESLHCNDVTAIKGTKVFVAFRTLWV
jgi:hypothetical protein